MIQSTKIWQELVSSENSTRLLDLSPDAVVICDTMGLLVFANKQTEIWFRYEHGELENQELEILMPERLRSVHRRHREIYFKAPVPRPMGAKLELIALRKDGTEFPVDISIAPAKLDGHTFFIAVIRDIAERKKTEEERDQAIRNREEVLAMVAHDLRNPLGAILLNAQLIEKSIQEPGGHSIIRSCVEKIQATGTRMNHLIQDVLTMKKMDAHSYLVDIRPIGLRQLLDSVIDMMGPIAERKSIRFKCEILFESDPKILCDPERIIRVFSNLIGNAIKFTSPGGSISVTARPSGNASCFSITDTGCGIPKQNLPHVFDRFWQAEKTAKSGTGLGLAIAKGIIEAHHGEIWVESLEGRGSTFYFRIPVVVNH